MTKNTYLSAARLRRVQEARENLAVGPWRCAKCNTSVVPGRNTPCKCFPKETL